MPLKESFPSSEIQKKEGNNDGKNGMVIGSDLPYYYLNKIEYPTGGYVTYDIKPIIKGDKYFYPGRNLTESVVWKRKEHTSVLVKCH